MPRALLVLALLVPACARPAATPPPVAAGGAPVPEASPALAPEPASRAAVDHPGWFLLLDLRTGERTEVHPEQCARATVPASTFKIPHSLIALQLGVVTDAQARVPWDGTPHWNKEWEAPHSLASSLQASTLWFFQRTAKAIGRERMRAQLHALRYGDEQVDGELTTFWLGGGSLEVTGPQQLDFLARMARHDLPVDRAHVDLVWDLLLADPARLAPRLPDGQTWPDTRATIRAKTGTDDGLTWWVGRVEGPRGDFVFVSRVEDDRPASATSPALGAGLRALADAGVL
jgi:beta-lactamase class D